MRPRNPNQFKTFIDDNGRVCTKCLQYKLWSDFAHSYTKKIITKRASSCIKCALENRKKVGRDTERELKKAKELRKVKKQIDPLLLKAKELRGRLRSRFKEQLLKDTTPSATDLYIWLRDTPQICYYSNITLDSKNISIDHKQPVIRGGTNDLLNLCKASHHMNTAKGQMTEQEFKQLLSLIATWEDGGKKLLTRLKQGHF